MEANHQFTTIARAIRFIRDSYTEQPSLEEVARHVHLSQFHFQRLFQQWAGVSPKQFLQYITLERAKEALRSGRSTLDTAYEVGLSGTGRLHDLFVKIEACSPGAFKKRGQGLAIQYATIETPFGSALVAETEKGICRLAFLPEGGEKAVRSEMLGEFPQAELSAGLGPNSRLVQQYFEKWEWPVQQIVLDLKGTPFQLQVWKALLRIPPAQLLSYQDIASDIGRPTAVRAVGTAIGRNPIAYLIPCHRVIRQNGELGGYRWDADRKAAIHGYEFARVAVRRAGLL